jgi:hypothetical protein
MEVGGMSIAQHSTARALGGLALVIATSACEDENTIPTIDTRFDPRVAAGSASATIR